MFSALNGFQSSGQTLISKGLTNRPTPISEAGFQGGLFKDPQEGERVKFNVEQGPKGAQPAMLSFSAQ